MEISAFGRNDRESLSDMGWEIDTGRRNDRTRAGEMTGIRVPVCTGQMTFAGKSGACLMFQYEDSGTDREKISWDTGRISVDRLSGIVPDFRSDLVMAVEEDRRCSATLRTYR
jgi:hypothetical protein